MPLEDRPLAFGLFDVDDLEFDGLRLRIIVFIVGVVAVFRARGAGMTHQVGPLLLLIVLLSLSLPFTALSRGWLLSTSFIKFFGVYLDLGCTLRFFWDDIVAASVGQHPIVKQVAHDVLLLLLQIGLFYLVDSPVAGPVFPDLFSNGLVLFTKRLVPSSRIFRFTSQHQLFPGGWLSIPHRRLCYLLQPPPQWKQWLENAVIKF